MQRYSDFRPTQFDTAGLSLEDRQDWFVAPVSRTRDTVDALTLSNFEAALAILGGESDTVEVHRFGHWGPGWFEIVLAAPCHETAVADIESRLEDYPSLDDDRVSELECEQGSEDWDNWGRRDGLSTLCDEFALSDATREWFDDLDGGERDRLYALYQDKTSGTEHDGEGSHFCWSNILHMSRGQLARWIVARRREERAHAGV